MTLFGQSQHSARCSVGVRDALLSDEALPDEVCYIRSHAVLFSVVPEFFKILGCNGTEFTNLSESPDFRRPDGVRSTATFVRLARFDWALHLRFGCAFECQPSIILCITARSLSPRGVGTVRLAVAGNRLGGRVPGREG